MNSNLERTPGSMLEIYMHALNNNTGDDFLDTVNLGVGNYEESEYWQQISAFRTGMYADAAMTRKIVERARLQTLMRLTEEVVDNDGDSDLLVGVQYPEPVDDSGDKLTKQQYLDSHGDDIWDNLGDREEEYTTEEHQAWLVNRVTGMGMNWTPPHWRMLKARHEASRSKDARLVDNLFGRPPEPEPMPPMEDFE